MGEKPSKAINRRFRHLNTSLKIKKTEKMTPEDVIKTINLFSNRDVRISNTSKIQGNLLAVYSRIIKENFFLNDYNIGAYVNRHGTTIADAFVRSEKLLKKPLWRDLYYDCVRYLDCKSSEEFQEGYYKKETYYPKENIDYNFNSFSYKSKIPDYIIKHLETYTIDELKDVYNTRLKPFKLMSEKLK